MEATVAPSPLFETSAAAVLAGVELLVRLIPLRRRRLEAGQDVAAAGEYAAWAAAREAWRTGMEAARSAGHLMRLLDVEDGFGLSEAETELLLLAMAPSVDPDFLDRLGRAHDTLFFRGIDVDLALGLLFPSAAERLVARDLLSPVSRLVTAGLITLRPVGSQLTPTAMEVRPSEAVLNFVLDRPVLSGTLAQFCTLTDPAHSWDQVIVPEEQKRLVGDLVMGEAELGARLTQWGFDGVIPRGRGMVLLFAGPPGTGKTAFAHAIAHRVGRPLLVVHTSRLIATREPILPVLTDIFRAAQLADAVVLADDCEPLLKERDARFMAMLEALEHNDGLVVLTTNLAPDIDFAMHRRIHFRLDFEPPDSLTREQIWEVHLPSEAPVDGVDVRALAATYELTGAMIRNTVLVALSRLNATGGDQLTMKALQEAAETQLGARFDDLAVKSNARFRLDRLVLPDREMGRLRGMLDACRVHDKVLNAWGFSDRLATGRGICALFDGPPGTGKTFTAEILAAELRLPMYRIHIPNIVSKWVGETERNIARVFQRARAARAMLLFDEADALFGRRSTGAQSSNDRYANMEVNLLLQEIERYDGVTILTTNLFGNLDEALQRRIQFRITFPFPGPEERGRIWETMIPAQAPLAGDIDFGALGRGYELAGGHIKNAVLKAAYAACAADRPIAQADFQNAALGECEAQGKLVRTITPTARKT